jgi:ribonuclease HII
MPDLTLERSLGGIVCGIDEVGRGPLAGPVLAAAVVLDPSRLPPEMLDGLDDSKALSAARREHWCAALRACGAAAIGIGAASVREIDGINILRATMLAMRRAVLALPVRPDAALVDGNTAPPDFPCPVQTVVGGDARCLSIAAASIVAKVTRDRVMAELGRRYAGYGWERNAGYGTAEHREAIRRLGVTRHHRRSFAPVRQNGHSEMLA